MKKKGFTLVELLAVIAILAILVIVAMPNVLGMFNQAKSSTFVTEVQEYMSAASTKFMTEALKPGNQGKTLYFSSDADTRNLLGGSELDMSGSVKNYFIEMDRNGEFERVVLWDANFCYDVVTGDNVVRALSGSNNFVHKPFEKKDVVVDEVFEHHSSDTVKASESGGTIAILGCAGNTPAQ